MAEKVKLVSLNVFVPTADLAKLRPDTRLKPRVGKISGQLHRVAERFVLASG